MKPFNLPSSYHKDLTGSQLMEKLLKDKVIDEKKLRDKLLVDDYLELQKENKGSHFVTKIILSEKYNLSERQIENIYYKYIKRKSRVKV